VARIGSPDAAPVRAETRGGAVMTDTERITNEIYERHAKQKNRLTRCATIGCRNLVAGSKYCSRCEEEIAGQSCSFLDLLLDRFSDGFGGSIAYMLLIFILEMLAAVYVILYFNHFFK
jgi:hypothetical protein